MIDPLGVFTLITAGFFVSWIFIGYYFFEDFTGIIFGVASATATVFVLREFWLAIATTLVGS